MAGMQAIGQSMMCNCRPSTPKWRWRIQSGGRAKPELARKKASLPDGRSACWASACPPPLCSRLAKLLDSELDLLVMKRLEKDRARSYLEPEARRFCRPSK